MLRSVKLRLSRIEEAIPIPITAELFVRRARRVAARAGASIDSAMASVAQDLSDGELDSLTAEFEQIAFGSDIAAHDAAKFDALSHIDPALSAISDSSSLENRGRV